MIGQRENRHRPTVVCVVPSAEDRKILEDSMDHALMDPLFFDSICTGAAILGTTSPYFVLIDYAACGHKSVLEAVNLCHRLEIPVAVMVHHSKQPKPRQVEEIGCMWLKDEEFLKIIPELILGGTGLLPPMR